MVVMTRQSPRYNFTPTLVCEWCGQTWSPGLRAQRRFKKPRTCGGKCRTALRIKEHGGMGPPKHFPPEIVERVRYLYYDEGLGQREIDGLIGPGHSAEGIMRRFNMPRRPVGGQKGQRTGESNPYWRGDKAGYKALHLRVEKARGKPKKCSRCGTTTAKKYEWANLTGDYVDINDYERMCVSCHHLYDAQRRRETGLPTSLIGLVL